MSPSDLQIHGYVIASANGMLADATGEMPAALKFDADQTFFNDAMDRVDVIVHGRNSFEDQANSPKRRRIIVTRTVNSVAPDPANPLATLWNPAGASFAQACEAAGVTRGTAAIIGGPDVFGMFMPLFDVFWLSFAAELNVPDGQGVFPGVPQQTPQQVLASHGLEPRDVRVLDPARDVTVTAWRRVTAAG